MRVVALLVLVVELNILTRVLVVDVLNLVFPIVLVLVRTVAEQGVRAVAVVVAQVAQADVAEHLEVVLVVVAVVVLAALGVVVDVLPCAAVLDMCRQLVVATA